MMQFIYSFVFHYPLFMAFVLMTGGLCYHLFRERKNIVDDLPSEPLVSILIPCHNEEECIYQTIKYLEHQEYKNFEIITINDASTDKTLKILKNLQKITPKLRILNMSSNQGKGMGLTMAAMAAKSEYLICIDADALLDDKAIKYFLWHIWINTYIKIKEECKECGLCRLKKSIKLIIWIFRICNVKLIIL